MLNHETFRSDDNSILFVALDTDNGHCSGTLTEDDISFLEGLDQSIPKIILTHHPAVSDPDEVPWLQRCCGIVACPDLEFKYQHIVEGQEDFLKYCEDESNNLYMVLSGHTHTNHVYNKTLGTPEQTDYPKYVITGSAGRSDYPVYRRISVSSLPVVEEFTQLTDEDFNYMSAQLYSPASLHVYDSSGEHTGYDPSGGSERGIPRSVYFSHYVFETEEGPEVSPEEVLICDPSDQYLYEIIGTEEGTYRLKLTSVSAGEGLSFYAVAIPTSPGVEHVYAVDWSALSAGDEGVTLEIDADGDGVFERIVIADEDLTPVEFALQTETVIDFEPDVLNLASKAKVVTVYIELPEGSDVSQIDVSTVKLNDSVSALSRPVSIGDYDVDGVPDLMVKFDCAQVTEALKAGRQVVTITGRLSDGTLFAEIDTIRVIGSGGAEATASQTQLPAQQETLPDAKEESQSTKDAGDTDMPEAFDPQEAVAFMLFEAGELMAQLGPQDLANEDAAFELACVMDGVFAMCEDGLYGEALAVLETDILQRMDGCVNTGEPDEDDWITSVEGQMLVYPLVVETIELLESAI